LHEHNVLLLDELTKSQRLDELSGELESREKQWIKDQERIDILRST